MLVVDKPAGATSFDVVRRVQRLLGGRKAGHTGTLDPMATGVLPVCVGEATKIAGLLTAGDKGYVGTGELGIETDTLDTTGAVTTRGEPGDVTREALEQVLLALRGPQLQTPPAYSAVRKDGERAYERARRGEAVELEPRPIEVLELELVAWRPPLFEIRLECSKGTYVRSLVAEVGQRLGCGAALAALRRTRSGPFTLEQAVALERLEDRGVEGALLSLDHALSFLPFVEVDAADAERLRKGQAVTPGPARPGRLRGGASPLPSAPSAPLVRLISEGKLVALGEQREGRLWPRRVFNEVHEVHEALEDQPPSG